MKIGFLGTGTISGAMVTGLSERPKPPQIVVSPRSEAVSTALAARYGNVRRAGSNGEVAESDVVVLGMRPAQLEEALAGLSFRSDQIVVSLVAGLSLAEVQKLAPNSRVARCVPMPGIARAVGPMTMCPGLPEIVDLLKPFGELFVVPEEQLNMGGLNAFMSSYFELQNALIRCAVDAGAAPEDARRFTVSLLGMLADTARITPAEHFDQLVIEHQTKGGLNEGVRARLLEQGWFEAPATVLADAANRTWRKLG